MQVVPLVSTPSQSLSVSLGGQSCQITIRQRITGLFIDLSVNNALVVGGVLCLNSNRIVREAYLGFIGDLTFYDTQGTNDPEYAGLGSRYILLYLAPGDTFGALM